MSNMPKKSKKQVDKLESDIRQLLNEGMYDEDIIDELNISRATYYIYKKKFIKEIVRYHKPNKNELEEQYSYLKKALEETYKINKQLQDNPKVPAQARIQASEMAAVARGQLYLLAKEGYLKPQLTVSNHVGDNTKVVRIDPQSIKDKA